MTKNQVEVAIAILYRDGKLLLQLRDDIPGIAYPGCWALFGGHIEPGEIPEIALKRELQEEIGYDVLSVCKFGCYTDVTVIRHVFYAQLSVDVKDLVLKEGWDMVSKVKASNAKLFLSLDLPEEKKEDKKADDKKAVVESMYRVPAPAVENILSSKYNNP